MRVNRFKDYILRYGILSYLVYGLFFMFIINPTTIYTYRLSHLRALYESNDGENLVDAVNYLDYGVQLYPGNKEIKQDFIESKMRLKQALLMEEESLKQYRTEKK